MRVAVATQGLADPLTGAGKALVYLLDRLRREHPRHEYAVLAPGRREGWRLPHQLWWEQVRTPWLARRLRADVLHAATGSSAPIAAGRRTVMTIHDVAPTRRPDLLPHARSRWYWSRFVPFTARFAAAVVVPSESTRRDLVDVVGLAASRVHLAPLGVPLDPPTPAGAAARAATRLRYGLPARYLLYVGTIDRRKDHPALLGALAHLDPGVPLVLAGTLIRGRTDFPERVERLGLAGRVRFLGYVPDGDLPALYEGAAVFVYPSFYEGFGLPVLEAMACGAPVVTYNATSLPELVGDAGVLLDPPWTAEALAAAIRRLLADEAWARSLRARGLERITHFDWSETARRTAAVYEAVHRACAGSS